MLIDILKLIKTINTRGALKLEPKEIRDRRYQLTCSSRRFIHELQHVLDIVKRHYRYHHEAATAHPSVKLFLECFYRHRNEDILSYSSCYEDVLGLAHDLMDTVDEFIRRLHSPSHKLSLRNIRRSESRNQESVYRYIDGLFDHYAKLLVVRLDIHYGSDVSQDISLEQAIEDRDYYLRRVKYQYDDLIGYIWKLEYGERKGFHYHITFIFNGANVYKDIPLGRALGELWVSMSNQSRWYHNCNAERDQYEKWGRYGIGMVRHNDTTKRHILLNHAINYLLKFDEELLAMMPERMNSLGKMQLPKSRGIGGRPRLIA